MVAILHQKLTDKQHQNEARQHHREGGKEAAKDAPIRCIASIDERRVADISGAIDADGSRSALADSHNVGELSHCHPMIMSHDLALNHGNHGITSAKTEETDEEEGPEKLK